MGANPRGAALAARRYLARAGPLLLALATGWGCLQIIGEEFTGGVHGTTGGGSSSGGTSGGAIGTSSGSSGGSSGGISTASGSSGTGGRGTTSGTTTGSTTGSSTGHLATGTSSGTSGGTIVLPVLQPTLILESGSESFGPVALAAGSAGNQSDGARLVYSVGDGGHFSISFLPLGMDGGALSDNQVLAETGSGLPGPPNVSVANDGDDTAVCWEDIGANSNPYNGCIVRDVSVGLVKCASVGDAGVEPSFSSCGAQPNLVFSASDGITQLFWDGPFGQVWHYGKAPYDSAQTLASGAFAAAAAAAHLDIYSLPLPSLTLQFVSDPFDGTYGSQPAAIDPNFPAGGQFALATQPAKKLFGIAELQRNGLRGIVWQVDEELVAAAAAISPMPLVGPVAAGTCTSKFAYAAVASGGALFFARQDFVGDLVGNAYVLGRIHDPVTSLVLARGGTSNVFLAASS